MRISLNDLVKEMVSRGYKITNHGVKYYVQKGLLPQPIKLGGYRKGVNLIFPDKDDVLSRLFKIFEMKGKGFGLAEIGEAIKDEEKLKSEYKRKVYLERFIEMEGKYFIILKREPNERWAESLKDVIKNHNTADYYLYNTPFLENDPEQVINRGLYLPSYIYEDRIIYPDRAIHEISAWIKLRRNYDIDWSVLESLYKKHTANFDEHFFWPNPDELRFTKTYIGWRRQLELNYFGVLFIEYIEGNIDKTLIKTRYGEILINWDFQYESVDILIREFLKGKCAFVPSSDADVKYFLKNFKV